MKKPESESKPEPEQTFSLNVSVKVPYKATLTEVIGVLLELRDKAPGDSKVSVFTGIFGSENETTISASWEEAR